MLISMNARLSFPARNFRFSFLRSSKDRCVKCSIVAIVAQRISNALQYRARFQKVEIPNEPTERVSPRHFRKFYSGCPIGSAKFPGKRSSQSALLFPFHARRTRYPRRCVQRWGMLAGISEGGLLRVS